MRLIVNSCCGPDTGDSQYLHMTLISAPFSRPPPLIPPSVIQVRTQDISPQRIGAMVVSAFEQFAETLNKGALVSIDEKRARARILPFAKDE